MKGSVVVLLCFISCLVIAQSGDYVEDGCYFINGELFGCMKAVYYPCDQEWFFQLTTVPGEGFSSRFVICEGIVPVVQEYYEDFTVSHVDGSQIDFTLHFYPAYGVTATSMFVGGEFLYSRNQDSDVDQSFEISDFEVVGAACGADSFNLPCPSTHQRSYTSNLESKGMVDIFNNHVSRGTYGDMFIIEDDCLLLKEHPNSVTPVGPFICPNVLLDTCGADALFTSRAGISLNIPVTPGTPVADTCIPSSSGYSFCIQPSDFYLEPNRAYIPNVTFRLKNTGDNNIQQTVYQWQLEGLEWFYPMCGDNHLQCIDYYSEYDYWQFFSSYTFNWSAFFSQLFGSSDSYWVISWTTITFTAGDFTSWDSPSSSNHHHHSSSNDSSSGGGNAWITGVVFGSLGIVSVLCAATVLLAFVLITKKKKNSTAVYELMTQEE